MLSLHTAPHGPTLALCPPQQNGDLNKDPKGSLSWLGVVLHGVGCPFGQLYWSSGDPASPGGDGPGSASTGC